MEKIRVAIAGYGNIGRYAAEAVNAAEDMELAGIVRRSTSAIPPELNGFPVTSDIKELGKVDVVLLGLPSRSVPAAAESYLHMGINTVDSFDIHDQIHETRQRLETAAKKGGAAAILSAGWDPGSDSVLRVLLEACAPKGITYTNFGPGMSMGHSVAARGIPGVKDALSITIPLGTSIHRRMVYVELAEDGELAAVTANIKADPYFAHDETHVIQVPSVKAVTDMGHGVNLTRKGVSGVTHNQFFEFNMKINNPALTAQIMTSCARAVTKRAPGAYTLIEVPMIDLLPGKREDIIRRLV